MHFYDKNYNNPKFSNKGKIGLNFFALMLSLSDNTYACLHHSFFFLISDEVREKKSNLLFFLKLRTIWREENSMLHFTIQHIVL